MKKKKELNDRDKRLLLEAELLPRLETAALSGDLPAAQQILDDFRSRVSKLNTEIKHLYSGFKRALYIAIRKNQLKVLAYFLDLGFKIEQQGVETAVAVRSPGALEVFLEKGWDIDDRWQKWRVPSIWYEYSYLFSYECLIN